MARRRVIEVEVESRSASSAIGWMLAGSAVGVVAGVLIAEKMSGRSLKGRSLWREARSLFRFAAGRWEPIVDAAIGMRDVWAERHAAADEDGFDDELDEEFDDEDDEEFDDNDDNDDDGDGEGDDDEGDDDEDDDLDEELDQDEDPDAEESDDELPSDTAASLLSERVLVAFENDPVLAERAVEIEADDEGAVVLHGAVRTSREVAYAVTLAGGVPGVRSVKQRLRVRAAGRR